MAGSGRDPTLIVHDEAVIATAITASPVQPWDLIWSTDRLDAHVTILPDTKDTPMTTSAIAIRVTITEAVQLLRDVYIPAGAAVYWRGPPGMSKTSQAIGIGVAMQDADPDFGLCYGNAANMGFTDWGGWPRTGEGVLASTRLPLIFQPLTFDDRPLRGAFPGLSFAGPIDERNVQPGMTYPRGLLVVDEASKSPDECRPALSMLAEEGRTGEWGVPVKGWCRLFIGNRVEDGSQDTDFPATFYNRVVVLDVYATIADIAPYWERVGMQPDFLAFARANSAKVLSDTVPAARQPFSTARSWFNAWSDVMAYCKSIEIEPAEDENGQPVPWPTYLPAVIPIVEATETDPTLQRYSNSITAIIAGRVGMGVAALFAEYIVANRDCPNYFQITYDPENCVIPTNPTVQINVVETLVHDFDIADAERVCAYLSRPEFPVPLAALWCHQIAEKHRLGILRQKSFFNLMNRLGLAAKLAMYE